MPFENVLNITPTLSGTGANSSSTLTSTGLSGTLYLATSGTTLGAAFPDLVATLRFGTVLTSTSSTALSAFILSAQPNFATANFFGLSSTSAGLSLQSEPVTLIYGFSGINASSLTPNGASLAPGNVVVGLQISDVNFATTNIYLSATSTGVRFDPTRSSTLDNPFIILNPSPAPNQAVRTTYGHARLVAYLG
jgi:hypothetical protein